MRSVLSLVSPRKCVNQSRSALSVGWRASLRMPQPLPSDLSTSSTALKAVDTIHDDGAAIWADTSLVGVALIWGINIPIMKNGLEQIDIFVFNAIRLTVSAAALALFAWSERRRRTRSSSGVKTRQILIYALMISAVYQLLFLVGIAYTTSGNTALIIATVPMWTALLSRLFLGERLQRLAWWGLVIALIGTAIVALQKGDVAAGSEHLLGNVVVLGSALLWAGGTVYSRPLLTQISPMQLSAAAAVIALPFHLLFAAGKYEASLPALRDVNLWLIILYSGILSSGLALPMWNYGVRHAGPSHAAIIQNLVPLFAIIAAWLARGEAVTVPQMIGGVLILGGLVTMRMSRRPAAATSR